MNEPTYIVDCAKLPDGVEVGYYCLRAGVFRRLDWFARPCQSCVSGYYVPVEKVNEFARGLRL